jgi:hypothetical protein
MKFKKLRIGWSIVFGVMCVLLIALWVRSYWWQDIFQLGNGRALASSLGSLQTCAVSVGAALEPRWILTTSQQLWPGSSKYSFLGIGYSPGPFWPGVIIPDWLPILLFAVLAAVPWINRVNWHFSLRTLLIAMTLVAVVLGLVASAAHR